MRTGLAITGTQRSRRFQPRGRMAAPRNHKFYMLLFNSGLPANRPPCIKGILHYSLRSNSTVSRGCVPDCELDQGQCVSTLTENPASLDVVAITKNLNHTPKWKTEAARNWYSKIPRQCEAVEHFVPMIRTTTRPMYPYAHSNAISKLGIYLLFQLHLPPKSSPTCILTSSTTAPRRPCLVICLVIYLPLSSRLFVSNC